MGPDQPAVSAINGETAHVALTLRRVTVLGDALHTMPPTGGLGGNAALHDARTLVAELAERPWPSAIPAYEAELRAHGYGTVREALVIRDHMLGAVPAR